MEICTVVTRDREEMVDITARLCAVESGKKAGGRGVAALLCPHTTCGLTINEGADPDVRRDMTAFFQPHHTASGRMAAWGRRRRRAALRRSLMGPVPVRDCGGRRTAASAHGRVSTYMKATDRVPSSILGSDGCPRQRAPASTVPSRFVALGTSRMVPRQAFIPEAREPCLPVSSGRAS